jgi:hypothetical protein
MTVRTMKTATMRRPWEEGMDEPRGFGESGAHDAYEAILLGVLVQGETGSEQESLRRPGGNERGLS